MPSSIIVRLVTRQDFDRWLPLWDGYNAFYGRSGETALANEITQMSWSRFFDAYEPVHATVVAGPFNGESPDDRVRSHRCHSG